ncbi:MAG: SEC-C domain-containing protein [Actinobacteria bacterium]|nr:SEC-C domain-containing protein [Actinomycetota bacterium]
MPPNRPATIPEIAAALESILGARGPLDFDDLLEATIADIDLGAEPEYILNRVIRSTAAHLVAELPDERVAYLPALLDGRIFTHRVTATELEHDFLGLEPDLDPVWMFGDDPNFERLTDGTPIRNVDPDDDDVLAERGIPYDTVPAGQALLLPDGHLERLGVGEGDLVGLRVTSKGFELERLDEAAVTGLPSGLAEGFEAVFALETLGDDPLGVDDLVHSLCADLPHAFRDPLPPLADVIDDLGLVREESLVGPPGFSFGLWRLEGDIGRVGRRYRIDDDEALAVIAMAQMCDRLTEMLESDGGLEDLLDDDGTAASREPGEGDESDRDPGGSTRDGDDGLAADMASVRDEMVELLANPYVAEALKVEVMGFGSHGAAGLGLFADSAIDSARASESARASRAALYWLRAKAFERLADMAAFEQSLDESVRHDPEFVPALYDLARIASDRGDATRGLALLRRADAPANSELVVLLNAVEPQPRKDLGRNDRCWCGSGRKYKQCHLGREQLSLEDRVGWLYLKAAIYADDGPWRYNMIAAAAARRHAWDLDDSMFAALRDPLVVDAVLVEGGAFAAFLRERGSLLPDDERLLAEQWLLIDRSLFEVEHVYGDELELRDLRTGDRIRVDGPRNASELEAGDLLCTRALPAGDAMRLLGSIETVGLHERDDLLALLDGEPAVEELVAFLSHSSAPPVLTNTEGEPMVCCEAVLRVGDVDALVDALTDVYDVVDDGDAATTIWYEHVTTHGMERIRATITLDGDELRVETNSEVRFDRVLDVVRALAPDATVIDESRTTIDDLEEAMRRAPLSPGGDTETMIDPDDPEVAAFLDETIRSFEQNWLDESIPALDGLTPREAAADPTHRDDLVRLLRSFDKSPADPGTMNTDRLREALGL